jgi:Transposase DDE domain/Transposase domain (DUF772)
MIGKRRPQRELFDVGNVYDLALAPGSFHAQLAVAAPRLFADGDFAVFYAERMGRPSVPPSQLALVTLMQHEAGCSDAEAVARTAYDLRWAAVLRRAAGEPLCAKSTVQLFRAHLVLHDEVRTIFERSLEEAKRAGLLKKGPLRIAVDTKPILGRGAVEDTYNLLSTGIQQLIRALAGLEGKRPEAWAGEHDLGRYLASSVKGNADLDWSDAEARQGFLTEIVVDARRLLRLAGERLADCPTEKAQKVRAAAQLLEQLLLQDVIETTGEDGKPRASVREGTAPGRAPSATDPEMRHGRKSKSKRFNGHKATVATDVETQIVVDADVLAGDAPDAQGVLQQVERVEQNTGQEVEQTLGDCAYGGGATRQAFADAQRELVAKVPQENSNNGYFPKSAFVLDLVNDTVTCPGGKTTAEFSANQEGGKLFHFAARCHGCELRAHCTPAVGGRQVRVHPQEALLAAARERQQTPEGRVLLRERVVAEHRLARLGQLRISQARYVGRSKTRFQLLIAATLANLRRVWNGQAASQAAAPAQGDGQPSGSAAAALTTAGQAAVAALRRAGGHLLRPARWIPRPPRARMVAGIPLPGFAPGVSYPTCRPRF